MMIDCSINANKFTKLVAECYAFHWAAIFKGLISWASGYEAVSFCSNVPASPHSCEALAHYRQLAKEQREQDVRKHVYQVQYSRLKSINSIKHCPLNRPIFTQLNI